MRCLRNHPNLLAEVRLQQEQIEQPPHVPVTPPHRRFGGVGASGATIGSTWAVASVSPPIISL
jgi:hypothetical protein